MGNKRDSQERTMLIKEHDHKDQRTPGSERPGNAHDAKDQRTAIKLCF